jgi:hypothetical protein
MFDELLRQHYNLDAVFIKDKLIQGGGGSNYKSYVNLLISMILFTIGLICMFYDKFWGSIDAKILYVKKFKGEAYIIIGYIVNNIEFTKIITISSKSVYNIGDKIKIFYDNKDPNIVKLSMINHRIIGIILMIIGIYSLISNYMM